MSGEKENFVFSTQFQIPLTILKFANRNGVPITMKLSRLMSLCLRTPFSLCSHKYYCFFLLHCSHFVCALFVCVCSSLLTFLRFQCYYCYLQLMGSLSLSLPEMRLYLCVCLFLFLLSQHVRMNVSVCAQCTISTFNFNVSVYVFVYVAHISVNDLHYISCFQLAINCEVDYASNDLKSMYSFHCFHSICHRIICWTRLFIIDSPFQLKQLFPPK